jgi:hypothetical protein
MTIQPPSLPSYPAHGGPIAAKQLENARARYRTQIEEIDAQLARIDEDFAAAFARADVSQKARDRISLLAQSNRAATRR